MDLSEREQFLLDNHGERTNGFLTEERRREFLDQLEILESNGLGLLVKNLLAALKRSKHLEGFGLELSLALICCRLPQPRCVQCEQKGGVAKNPGDIWLTIGSRRFEFQCKYSQNWTVELYVADARDIIYEKTKDIVPGLLYELNPENIGSREQWQEFALEIVKNARSFKVGDEFTFKSNDIKLAHIKFFQERKYPGFAFGSESPRMVQVLDIGTLRKKITDASSAGKPTISAIPSDNQINILMIDVVSFLVDLEDFFSALYGEVSHTLRISESGKPYLEPQTLRNGIFYNQNMETWSAVGVLRHRSGSEQKCYIFPNPAYFDSVESAFNDLANFCFVRSSKDVTRD